MTDAERKRRIEAQRLEIALLKQRISLLETDNALLREENERLIGLSGKR